MASASSAMVSGCWASARISSALMPRDSVWDGEAWAVPAFGVMGSILGAGSLDAGRAGRPLCSGSRSASVLYGNYLFDYRTQYRTD